MSIRSLLHACGPIISIFLVGIIQPAVKTKHIAQTSKNAFNRTGHKAK